MARFRPLGRAARWRLLYEELFVPAGVGDVVTFEQMAEVLDLDPVRDRHKMRSPVLRAQREYLAEQGHAMEAVRDVGYQVVGAAGHIVLAHRQQRRATSALEWGHQLATQIDLSNVDPNVRNALHAIGNGFALQMDLNRKFDVRQRELAQAIEATQVKQDRTADEVAALRERLHRLEGRIEE